MTRERAWMYVKWLAILILPLCIPTLAMISANSDVVKPPNGYEIGHVAMMASFVMLMYTAMIGGALLDIAAPFPGWAWATVVYGLIGMFVSVFTGIDPNSTTSAVSVTYITGGMFCLNSILIFLAQTWVAREALGLPLAKTLPIHGLFLVWTTLTFTRAAYANFVLISAFAVVAVLLIAISVALFSPKFRLKSSQAQDKPAVGPD